MSKYLKIGMDRKEIRHRAYFLSQFNFDYSSLVQSLVKLEIKFENQEFLHMPDWWVAIDMDLFDADREPSSIGKGEMLKYNYYMPFARLSPDILHWLIAERQYLLDCIQQKRNVID